MTPSSTTVLSPAAERRGAPRRVLTALALVVALCTPMLVGPVQAQARKAPRTMTTTERSYSRAVLAQLNAERARHHLKPLKVATHLISSARTHNLDMSAHNAMSHKLPGEKTFDRRISETGYKWSWVGENIAWNSTISKSGVKYLQALMYNEKPPNNGHRLNILNSHFTNVGIDIYIDTAHHKVWMTQDFGCP